MEQEKFKAIFSKEIYQLPIRWDGKNFYDTLYKHLKGYREDIKLNFKDPNLHNAVETVCRKLCIAVDYSFRGYPGKAYESFKDAMKILNEKPLLIDEKKINEEPLYRVVDVGNAAIPDRKRIFHVPFSFRSKMSTQRYSIPGFPSLYLGTSVKLCCMELGKDPQRDYVCVSRFELQTDHRTSFFGKNRPPVFDNDIFKIFDVSIKPENAVNTLSDDDKMITYIQWYPLISACSYIRAMRDAAYSAEYIIPQLFTQWVRSEYEHAVVGIKYFSCAPAFVSTLGNNYVFPSTGTPYHVRKNITNYCARLSNRFKLTTPRFIMEYVSIDDCVDYINKDENLKYIEDHNAGEDLVIEGDYSIPEGTGAIGAFAFFNCHLIKSIKVPDSVTSIGDSAFSGCSSLTNINIPDSVTSIGGGAFNHCMKLTSIKIPNSVTSIGDSAFWGCSSLTNINIPDSVARINYSTFCGCDHLTNINIPESVTSIGDFAFYECRSLTIIKIPESVTSISAYTFCRCRSLTCIDILGSVTSIGDYAFFGCRLLTRINIPESVTSIGDYAFYDCRSLKGIKIPESVTSISAHAFCECSSLTSINIPDSVTSINDNAFRGCSSLISIKIPDRVTSISAYTFCGLSSLTSIDILGSVTSIGDNAFCFCRKLTCINIPDSVKNIGDYAFYECSSLTSINIPDSLTSISAYTFRGLSSLTSINIPESVTSIGDCSFQNCGLLKSINIPESVMRIGDYAFSSCSSLTSVNIPESVTNIGDGAFDGCSSLDTVYFSGTEKQAENIIVGEMNECLKSASWVYSPSGK